MTYQTDWMVFIRRYLIVLVCVAVVIYAVRVLFGHNLNSSGATVVPIIMASMLEGRDFARAEGRTPSGMWAWQKSLMFGLIGIAISMGAAAFFMGAMGGSLGALLTPAGFTVLSIMTGVMAVIFVLGARLFFYMGARSEVKVQERSKD